MARKYRQPGFTLIEMAVACAMATVLLGGVLMVLGGIVQDRARLTHMQADRGTERAQIVNLLRQEIVCASDVQAGENSLVLHTSSSINPNTFQVVDRPSIVTYRLLTDQNLGALVRRQEFTDEPVAPKPSISLLACGIQKFTVQEGNASDQSRHFSLHMEFEDSKVPLDELIVVR